MANPEKQAALVTWHRTKTIISRQNTTQKSTKDEQHRPHQ